MRILKHYFRTRCKKPFAKRLKIGDDIFLYKKKHCKKAIKAFIAILAVLLSLFNLFETNGSDAALFCSINNVYNGSRFSVCSDDEYCKSDEEVSESDPEDKNYYGFCQRCDSCYKNINTISEISCYTVCE